MTTTQRLGITLPDDSTNATTQFFIDRYNEIDANAAKKNDLDAHIVRTDNPHSVTKSQVGLGNVDNTSDLDKPVSTVVAVQLANKQAFKLTDDNGYATTTPDLNDITGTKTIALSTSVVNRPFDYGTVFQVSNTDQTKTQIAVDNYSGTTATRSYNSGGGWSSWATKANQSDLLSMVNTASFGSSGWFKDKKTGLLLQWGTISATYTPTYVAFPTGFPNNCYFIGITPNHGDTTAIANVIDKSQTAFHIQTNKSNSLFYLWFALGS
jgi:hypothetical protein